MTVDLATDHSVRAKNSLLDGLPRDEWDQISQHLQLVPLAEQAALYVSGEPIGHAYFPLSGCASVLLELPDGFTTEIGQAGNEGMLGLPLVMGESESLMTAVVQVSGEALRISAAAFTTHLSRLPTLHRRLLRFAGKSAACSAQLAACNTRHTLDERLVRCLLGLGDRAQDRSLAVTHEILASLLCVHRPSVSVALSRLQRLELIKHRNRCLVIADRPGLERVSCECYAIMRDLRCSSEM